jgi:hypothetical protein
MSRRLASRELSAGLSAGSGFLRAVDWLVAGRRCYETRGDPSQRTSSSTSEIEQASQ